MVVKDLGANPHYVILASLLISLSLDFFVFQMRTLSFMLCKVSF